MSPQSDKTWINLESIDHGRSDELGCWGELEKIARFEKLKNFCRVFQNDLAFLGRIGKPSLSEFPEIYDSRINISRVNKLPENVDKSGQETVHLTCH